MNSDLQARIAHGASEALVLLENPYSPRADCILDGIVARYNHRAYEFIADADLLLHRNWPKWHRLLQVRFIQLACAERPSVRSAVAKALQSETTQSLNELMREVLRQCILEIFAWGKENKDKPKRKQAKRAKRPDIYWHEAFDSLDGDIQLQNQQGKTIDETPAEWTSILGKDYSLRAVPY